VQAILKLIFIILVVKRWKLFERYHPGTSISKYQEMGIEYWPDKIQEVLDRL
jgi:hypothetical protein